MPIVIFLAALVLYLVTLTNTIFGGDSGDLVSAILTNGFAHPPGYPLFTILGIFFNALPLPLTPAGKATLISSISTALSLTLVYLLIRIFDKKNFNVSIALITCGTLATNYLIWLYASVPEVFPLNTLLTLLVLFTATKLYLTKNLKYLYATAFIFGLGVAHHHTLALSLPSVGYLLWKTQQEKSFITPKTTLIVLGAGLLGCSPYLYAVIRSYFLPEVFWGDMNTVKGFFFVFLRQGYGTFQAGTFVTQNYLHRLIQFKNIGSFVLSDFSVAGVLFILIGLIKLIRPINPVRISLLLALFFYGPFFFFYANFPLYDTFEFATIERFFIVFYFLLAIPLYFGLRWAYEALIQLFTRFSTLNITFIKVITIITFILFPLSLGIKNYPYLATLKNDRTAEKLGEDILNNVPKNSIILLGGDTTLFNTQYMYYSDKEKYKDKKIVHASKATLAFYAKSLKKNYPELVIKNPNDFSLSALISSNNAKFPIYSNYKYPLNDPAYEWVPNGILFKLQKKAAFNQEVTLNNLKQFWKGSVHRDLSQELKDYPLKWRHFFLTDILSIYTTAHLNSAYYFLEGNDRLQARYHLIEAHDLKPNDLDYYYLLSQYHLQGKDCKAAEETIEVALKEKTDELFMTRLEEVKDCYEDIKEQDRVKKRIETLRRMQAKPLRDL